MNLIQQLYHSFKNFSTNRAFCINGQDITYSEFLKHVNGIRELLEDSLNGENQPIGIICYECVETYATIFASWFSGHYFIPVNPRHPLERNMKVIRNTGTRLVTSPRGQVGNSVDLNQVRLLNTAGLSSVREMLPIKGESTRLMYVLTTSGSTGIPKHVPISLKNVEAYCTAFLKMFPELNSNINVLQVHDHTTDAAFTSYLLPLMVGACVYTLPDDQFKFLSIARLMTNKELNWVKMTPSVLTYLTPYISKLDLKHIRYFGFGGEALPLSLLGKWWPSFPDAQITNYYGPTEATMLSTFYKFKSLKEARSLNGTIAIGKLFPGMDCVVLDREDNLLEPGKEGELCLARDQIMQGYLYGDVDPFVYLNRHGERKKFYRTGDLVCTDPDGLIYFMGRIDDQVKIEGYRVNLIEVENTVKSLIPDSKVVVLAHEKLPGLNRLYVFLEKFSGDLEAVKQKLAAKLPRQMVPEEVFTVPEFPFTSSGKIDRKKLKSAYLSV